jgi:hypothetical protein
MTQFHSQDYVEFLRRGMQHYTCLLPPLMAHSWLMTPFFSRAVTPDNSKEYLHQLQRCMFCAFLSLMLPSFF